MSRSQEMLDIGLVVEVGDRVKRGRDWAWGNQDGNPPGQGTVTGPEPGLSGWWKVHWDSGMEASYRVGAEDKYDLEIIWPDT
ncbi:hypothetical protein BaRGS_00033835 [Batillaria attramentaria]|uniref:MIB/HERC2 domain-containing protein n=1 Tax=Batillaria attramentaria TaxID=370345 RepID=A0ABD0JJJ6_9CAEN